MKKPVWEKWNLFYSIPNKYCFHLFSQKLQLTYLSIFTKNSHKKKRQQIDATFTNKKTFFLFLRFLFGNPFGIPKETSNGVIKSLFLQFVSFCSRVRSVCGA